MVTVVAPKSLRIKRLLERDTTTVKKIEAIMANQWTDEEKVKLSDYVIENIDMETTKNQVKNTHLQILKKSQKR